LNSPLRIGIFALCIVLIVGAFAFGSIRVGASVNANKTIGLDKGVAVALADAGFTADDVANLTAHYDSENGVASYEVEFTAAGFEYDYTIKAADGKIIEASREAEKAQVIKESDIKFEDEIETQPQQSAQQSEPEKPVQVQETQPQPVQQPEPEKPASKYVGVDKAKAAALKDAGLSSSEVTFTKAKLDKDDGIAVYEIEFFSGNTEYDYEISATSGKIRDKDIDWEDDWDDDWDD
ncbi:MAG: PepSY domain-containing protein, partial [Firmicutes bacterium]|nr:PepSY domain-containing protein [Bacillota bacterium]